MPSDILPPTIDALVRRLARATGEDVAVAVRRAIEERLARLPARTEALRAEEIDALFDRLAALPVRDARPIDEIIGYDRRGVPA